MEILWAALAVCAIVSVAFYVLAISWQRVLRGHSRAIHTLFHRLETLESLEDPLMRRRIGELMPSPLEQVHILTFRLGDRFWRATLGATEQQVRQIHEHGTFIGSVQIEVWRSHVAITLRELLPQAKAGGWQTRTLDVYTQHPSAPSILWQLCLNTETNSRTTAPPIVELRYEDKFIVLAARNWSKGTLLESARNDPATEKIIFRIPLDVEKLAPFRVPEGEAKTGLTTPAANAWVASFSHQDEQQEIDWQLHVRSLDSRSASGQWTIMEHAQVRRVSS